MSGIPRKECGLDPETIRHDALVLPMADGVEGDRMIDRNSEQIPRTSKQCLLVVRRLLPRATRFGHEPLGRFPSVVARAERLKRPGTVATRPWLDEVREKRGLLGPHRQIGADVAADDVADRLRAFPVDTEQIRAHPSTIGADEVPGAHLSRDIGLAIVNRRENTPAGQVLDVGELLMPSDAAGARGVGMSP